MNSSGSASSGAANAKLLIGPAGWSYKDWVGPVYPAGERIDQLLYIARHVNCIELNSSFYRTPGESLVHNWDRRISPLEDFKFTVKARQRFTHERILDDKEVNGFIHVFDPLLENKRIGAFLLQFPWSFKNTAPSRAYLEKLGRFFSDHPTAVELRHASWDTADTLKLLSDEGLSFCNIDQPVIGESIPPTAHVTDPRAGYIRLHGRNRRDWFRPGAGRDARYDYLYDAGELEEWRERAERMMSKVRNLFIITNNHFRGQALVNAFQIRARLEDRPVAMPDALVEAYPVLGSIAKTPPADGLFDF